MILQTTAVEHKMMDIFLNDANVDFEKVACERLAFDPVELILRLEDNYWQRSVRGADGTLVNPQVLQSMYENLNPS